MAKQRSHTTGPDGKVWERKVFNLTASIYDKDKELLDWLQKELSCGRSEVIRTAIRLLAVQFTQVSVRSGISPPSPDSINSGED